MSAHIMRVCGRFVRVALVTCGGHSVGLRTLEIRVGRLCLSVTLDVCVDVCE